MARPSAMTPKKIERLRELRGSAKGKRSVGLREAAKAIGVSHETARAWENRDASKGAKRKASAKTRSTKRPAAEDAAAVAAILDAPLPSASDPEALANVRARAALVRGLLERLTPGVEADEYPATSYVTLARYGDELARLLAELTPPAPKDPNEDQNIIEAERILLARIEGMVADAEHTGGVAR